MLDVLESDDLEYIKGMICAQHNDYFKTLAQNYCYKNGLPIEMAIYPKRKAKYSMQTGQLVDRD